MGWRMQITSNGYAIDIFKQRSTIVHAQNPTPVNVRPADKGEESSIDLVFEGRTDAVGRGWINFSALVLWQAWMREALMR